MVAKLALAQDLQVTEWHGTNVAGATLARLDLARGMHYAGRVPA